MILNTIQRELRQKADLVRAKELRRFFKSRTGEYGHGDRHRGVSGKDQKPIALKYYRIITLDDCERLLQSVWHDERQTALRMLVYKFERSADEATRHNIYTLYLRNRSRVNNWDLVDCSARQIIGGWLYTRKRTVLYRLVRSRNLWERRIAIIATYFFLMQNDFHDTFALSKILLYDQHDLIHKAVGWMLREVGERDRSAEQEFLKRYYTTMPRTMLRYAIEKFPEKQRQRYLNGRI